MNSSELKPYWRTAALFAARKRRGRRSRMNMGWGVWGGLVEFFAGGDVLGQFVIGSVFLLNFCFAIGVESALMLFGAAAFLEQGFQVTHADEQENGANRIGSLDVESKGGPGGF